MANIICRKIMKKIIIFFALIIIISCSKEIPYSQSVERNGLKYEVNSEEPFSGTIISNSVYSDLNFKMSYKNGVLNGVSEGYYSNGQIKYKENYLNGKPDGVQEAYYESGQIKSKSTIRNGELDGIAEKYYENGQKEYKHLFKNGKRANEGVHTTYYFNGQIKSKFNYLNGELDGVQEAYYESGQIKSKENYLAGTKEGVQEKFFQGDSTQGLLLETRETWQKGKLNGIYESYADHYRIGVYPLAKGKYEHGFKKGYWVERYGELWDSKDKYFPYLKPAEGHRTGTYELRGNYKNDKKEGKWELHSISNDKQDKGLRGELFFKEGVVTYLKKYLIIVSDNKFPPQYIKSNGRLYEEGPYKDGEKTGIHYRYDTRFGYTAVEHLPNGYRLHREFYGDDKKPSSLDEYCWSPAGSDEDMKNCSTNTPMSQFWNQSVIDDHKKWCEKYSSIRC